MALTAVRLFSPPGRVPGDAWTELRTIVGARPPGIVQFATRRSRLDTLRPGEQLLIIRKYGGLGDILISSMLFPALAAQYPDVRVAYAVPMQFHPLFEGSGLRLVAYEGIWGGQDAGSHSGSVRAEILEQYDLIEDISIPCHIWENFFVAHGGIDGDGHGLRWRNRLDMWSRWFGLQVETARTNIVIRDDERSAARRRLQQTAGTGRPICLLAPFAYNRTKSFPWFAPLAARLEAEGYAVILLHNRRVPHRLPTLFDLSLRQMGAACAAADLIVSVDTAAYHWGGILGRPTVGIFNVNNGAAYAKYYPTATIAQTCPTPCINVRYGPGEGTCPLHTRERLPVVAGIGLSRCYGRSTVETIGQAVHRMRAV
jgi:hypothetical protein